MSRLTIIHRSLGFTLIEVSVVIVIIGVLIGIFIAPINSVYENQKRQETKRLLQEAQDALVGFAANNNGRLPRPATGVTGLEQADCTTTNNTCFGFLPWAVLGISGVDGFGNVLRYKVYAPFARTKTSYTSNPMLTVSTTPGTATNAITNAAFVLISNAKRYAGTDKNNVVTLDDPVCPHGADEQANLGDNTTASYSHSIQDSAALPGGCFDDIVSWMSGSVLYSRLATLGILLN